MSRMKKAVPAVETGDGGAGQLILEGFSASKDKGPVGQQHTGIASLLLPGAGNAVPLRQLAAMTGRDEREVRRAIRRERLAGVPILADNRSGYFLPSSEAERVACARSMRHRARQILAAASAIEAARDGGGGA